MKFENFEQAKKTVEHIIKTDKILACLKSGFVSVSINHEITNSYKFMHIDTLPNEDNRDECAYIANNFLDNIQNHFEEKRAKLITILESL